MVQFIKYRIGVTTLLFGAFGGALGKLIDVEGLTLRYFGFACLIAFLTQLLVAFLIKAKWSVAYRNRLKKISVVLFIFFLAAAAFHIWSYDGRTFTYEERPGEASVNLIRGNHYSEEGDSVSRANKGMLPAQLLKRFFGGKNVNERLWDESLHSNTLLIVGSYCLMVLLFSAIASLLIEVLVSQYKDKNALA